MATKVPDASVIRVRGGFSEQLAVIAQRVQAFTNASGTAIALSEGNAAEIICRARAGSSAPEVGTALRVAGTFTGLCIQSGKELHCDDAETDARVDKAAMRALGIRSMAAIPIKEEGLVVGVLAVFAPTAHAFGITHVVVLKTIAGQIADYLRRTQRAEAYSPEPLPAPPLKAVAVPAAALPVPPPAVKPAEPPLTHRRRAVGPKVKPLRATTVAEEIDPAPFSQPKEANSHDEHKESKAGVRDVFDGPDAAAAPENRPGANVLVIGVAALMVIAAAVALWVTLSSPAPAPEPGPETSSSPVTPATPAPASANVQPPAKNTPPAPPAEYDEEYQPRHQEAQPRRKETVVLSAGPSRISAARGNSAPTPDVSTPDVSLDSVPASGSLSNLASPVSQPPHPRLMESELEPVTAIKKVPPVYPQVAKQQRLSADLVVRVTVNKNGRISDLHLISGSPLFRDAAFAAVKQWVFKPARLNGQTIEQSTTIRLHFGAR